MNPRASVPRLAIMLDGVVANHVEAVLEIQNESEIEGGPAGWWHIRSLDCLSKSAYEKAANTEYFWSQLRPFDDIDVEFLHDRLREMSFSAHFICHRPPSSVCSETPQRYDPDAQAIAWLDNLELRCAAAVNTSVDDIAMYCIFHGIDRVITDNPEDAACLRASGISTALYDRPWNRDAGGERVYSLAEALESLQIPCFCELTHTSQR